MTTEELDAVAAAETASADLGDALLARAKTAEAKLVPPLLAKQAADEIVALGVIPANRREELATVLGDPTNTLNLLKNVYADYAKQASVRRDLADVDPGTAIGAPRADTTPTAQEEYDAKMALLRQRLSFN